MATTGATTAAAATAATLIFSLGEVAEGGVMDAAGVFFLFLLRITDEDDDEVEVFCIDADCLYHL